MVSSLLFPSTPEPNGWEEIVSEELEGISDWGCPTTKKKVVVPYPDDKVRNLGVTSSDWDDILKEFNNGMAGYWSSAAHTGPIALIFVAGVVCFFLIFFGVIVLPVEDDYDGESMPSFMIPPVVVFGIVMVVTTGMKVQNKMYDAKLNNLLTEKVNSRFEAKGLLVKLHVVVHEEHNDRKEQTVRAFVAYIRAAAPSAEENGETVGRGERR
jgi:hypothetical protein